MTPDTSIILKGLTPLVKPSFNWLGKKVIGKEILERRQFKATALQPVLQQAAENIAEIIEPIGKAEIDQISLFLTSNEAEAIVRQIYAASILKSKEQNLEQIEQEFLKAFALYTNIPEADLEDSAPQIFHTLVTGCEETLQIAINEGRLSAHEARSSFRHQVLLDEIANIQKNLEFLSTSQQLDLKAVLEFEGQYRQQVEELHGKLTPPYISEEKKLAINNLYVCPNFSQEIFNRDNREQTKNQSKFYQSIYRTVLLGNPGGGKSTCGQKLCYDLVNQYDERLLGSRQVTPILVILRDYGVKKKEINCSLLEFIELTAKTKYQLQPPPGAFAYLLLNGYLAIVFDGLDELTETSYRQQIRNDVELFCNLYPSVPVLVTSREVGYKEAPLDESKFEVYRLAPFNDQQVKEYVTKWFAIDRELTKEQQNEKIQAFLAESKNLTDLRSNPLMLGLMCNIYKGEGYIPRNRPDVYAKCAEMLFERWDRGRGIKLPALVKEIESKIKYLMMYLANWIYTNESLQSGVTERKLIEKATDYLHEKRFEDRDDAECAAKAFIHFCRGRAWVFTNVGTNKNNEELYQFTHRTFLEYFTAAYLNRIFYTPVKLFKHLLPRITQQEWEVVCQLAFQIQNTKFEDAGDELLTYLIEEIKKSHINEKWSLLYFTIRCLEFIVPSASVIKSITCVLIDEYINFGINQIENYHKNKNVLNSRKISSDTIDSLHKSTNENLKNIVSGFKHYATKKINYLSDNQFSIFLELINVIKQPINLDELEKEILNSYKSKIKSIAAKDLLICILYQHKNYISLLEIIEWHGIDSLFYDYECRIKPGMSYMSISLDIFWNLCCEVPGNNYLEVINKVSQLGNLFMVSQLPIIDCVRSDFSSFASFNRDSADFLFGNNILYKDGYKVFSNLIANDYDALFGGYIIFAVYLEIGNEDLMLEDDDWLYKEIEFTEIPFSQFILYIFLARFRELGKYDRQIQSELDKCNFNQEQRDFIWKWVRREIDLVALADAEEEN